MASTSTDRDHSAVLPHGWSRHESTKIPGKFYYFNELTGARTWDLRDVGPRHDKPSTSNTPSRGTAHSRGPSNMTVPSPDINSLSVEQLEQLIEKKKKQEAGRSFSKNSKRKSSDLNQEQPKRQKIVFDLPNNSNQIKKNPIVTSDRLLEKKVKCSPHRTEDRSSAEVNTGIKKNDSTRDSLEDSQESLVFEDDELEEFKKIKTKHKSPPKPKKVPSPDTSVKDESPPRHVQRALPQSTSPSISPSRSFAPTISHDSSFGNRFIVDSVSRPTFRAENFKTKYENYEMDPKLSYQRRPVPSNPTRTSSVQHDERHSDGRYQLTSLSAVERPVDVTPDHDCDVTPVFGSFDEDDIDQLECGDDASNFCDKTVTRHGALTSTENMFAHLQPQQPENFHLSALSEVNHDDPEEPLPDDNTHLTVDDSLESSFEADRPPSPSLLPIVQELEEEEGMEWESVDMENVLKETQRVRQTISCEETGHDDDAETSYGKDGPESSSRPATAVTAGDSRRIVVIDTNVLISNLATVNKLLEEDRVLLTIPWMVVQELDKLKVCDNNKTAVGARAGVRWLNNILNSSLSKKVVTETADQSRKVSAKFQSKSPDDRILATCLQLHEDDVRVILLTNDVNLSNKAMINNITSTSADNITDLLLDKNKASTDLVRDAMLSSDIVKDLVEMIKEELRVLLEEVLRQEFIKSYDDLWLKIVSIKPKAQRPFWSLSQLFTLFSKHHIAVFSPNFERDAGELKTRLTSVKELLTSKKVIRRFVEIRALLSEIDKLVEVIKRRDGYNQSVTVLTDKLKEITEAVTDAENEAKNQTRTIIDKESVEDCSKVQAFFQHIWEVIAVFTRGFAKCVDNVPTDVDVSLQPNIQFHSPADVSRELPGFYKSVKMLEESMLKALNKRSEDSLVRFFEVISGFKSSLELNVSYWQNIDDTVSRGQFLMFMMKDDNRELLMNGYNQISRFSQTLVQCLYQVNSNM